jgi:peptidoglycan/LPS O-acetylase OafA/YrhL
MPPDWYYAVTWSLAIEEWFYLLFGVALVLLSRRLGGQRALGWCIALFMLIPLGLRLVCQSRDGMVYLRIDEIAYGVLMARLYVSRNGLFRHPWLAAGIGACLIVSTLAFALLETPPFPIALLPNMQVIGCALCLPLALRLTQAAGWFATPVRWVASRSYALYLIHLTILSDVAENGLFETGLLSAPGCVAIAVVTPFLLADVSYRWFETPILRWRPSHRPRQGASTTRPPFMPDAAALQPGS